MTSAKLADSYDLDRETHRAQVHEQLRELVESGHPRLGFDRAYGGEGDIGGSVVSFELLGYGDLSLMVKAGVQWGLFGGAVQMLGTERHHERYAVRRAESRRQFRRPNSDTDSDTEIVLLGYLAHQRKLLPALPASRWSHLARDGDHPDGTRGLRAAPGSSNTAG